MTFRVEALGDQRLDSFDCGREDLDDWLKRNAIAATGQGTRTYVLVGSHDDESVVGYFAVAPHLLAREVAPRSVGRGAPAQIPAILLAKLALDRSVQGLGTGPSFSRWRCGRFWTRRGRPVDESLSWTRSTMRRGTSTSTTTSSGFPATTGASS